MRQAMGVPPGHLLTAPAVADVVAGAYAAFHAELSGFLRRETREAEVAEDLAQEAFLRLQRELLRGNVPDNPRAWLYRVAANLAISRGRRMAVARRRLADTWPEAGWSESPESSAIRVERQAHLGGALRDLTPEARLGLMMAAHGFSGREIATALGRSEVSTRTLLCRARLRVRGRLVAEELAQDDG
jgi:RNA polymerase sigma-70 factor (ECF subfamily)